MFLPNPAQVAELDPGVMMAPVGCVTVAFMNVVGTQTLLSWNGDVAQQALKTFHAVVGEQLAKHGGYLVRGARGEGGTVYTSPG